jgi:hypothetical protein
MEEVHFVHILVYDTRLQYSTLMIRFERFARRTLAFRLIIVHPDSLQTYH